MMRVLRPFLATIAALLCCVVTVQFFLMMDEIRNWSPASSKFAVDAFPQYSAGIFHLLSFVLLATSLFTRNYNWMLMVAVAYFLIDVFATYASLGSGFLGGDMCPDGHPCLKALRRASLFDWTAATLLLAAVGLITSIIVLQVQAGGV
jgi:hypothetical protein